MTTDASPNAATHNVSVRVRKCDAGALLSWLSPGFDKVPDGASSESSKPRRADRSGGSVTGGRFAMAASQSQSISKSMPGLSALKSQEQSPFIIRTDSTMFLRVVSCPT